MPFAEALPDGSTRSDGWNAHWRRGVPENISSARLIVRPGGAIMIVRPAFRAVRGRAVPLPGTFRSNAQLMGSSGDELNPMRHTEKGRTTMQTILRLTAAASLALLAACGY